jgi:hypothetical protein
VDDSDVECVGAAGMGVGVMERLDVERLCAVRYEEEGFGWVERVRLVEDDEVWCVEREEVGRCVDGTEAETDRWCP